MSLLVINALPTSDVDAQKAIKAMNPDLVLQADDLRLLPCIGCNACWLKTPGICAIKDDYPQLLKRYLAYDTTIFLAGTALGFEEAAQASCAKAYVETLPRFFGCEYAGTLTKGGNVRRKVVA